MSETPAQQPSGPRDFVTLDGVPLVRPRPRSAGSKVRKYVSARPVRSTIAAVSAVVVVAAAGVSLASFRDGVQVAVEVAAGTLDITVDGCQGVDAPCELAIDGLSALKPGDSKTATFEVENPGSLPAVVTIDMAGENRPDALGQQLDAKLTASPSGSPAVTTSGKANGLHLQAFTIPAGTTTTVGLDLSLAADTANTWQGTRDVITISVDAVQE